MDLLGAAREATGYSADRQVYRAHSTHVRVQPPSRAMTSGGAWPSSISTPSQARGGRRRARCRQVGAPQADVVGRRLVDLRLAGRVDRFHEIDLDAGERQDVLVDVLALAAKRVDRRHTEQVD